MNAGKSFKPNDLSQFKHGIFVSDVSVQPDSSFFILHNNIINPKSDGIRFSSTKSKNNVIASNVIINPGNFDFYQFDNTRFYGIDSYLMFQHAGTDVLAINNFLDRTLENVGFYSTELLSPDDFRLKEGSPLIDAANFCKQVPFDFFGTDRPQGVAYDIWAVEYFGNISFMKKINRHGEVYFLYQNPVDEILKIGSNCHIQGSINLTLYNIAGAAVKVKNNPVINLDNHTIQLNVSHLISGLYIYNIQESGKTFSGKFIKK